MDRRAFLSTLAAACLAPGCVTIPTARLEADESGVIRVPRADFQERAYEGRFLYINPGQSGPHLLLVRDIEGTLRALSTTCTHLGCRVRASGGSIRCPCHGATYALSGEVLRGPASRPLPSYALTEEAEHILIDTRSPL